MGLCVLPHPHSLTPRGVLGWSPPSVLTAAFPSVTRHPSGCFLTRLVSPSTPCPLSCWKSRGGTADAGAARERA